MRLVLIGASGHGKVCSEIAQLQQKYEDIFFLDDNRTRKVCSGYPVAGVVDDFEQFLDDKTEFFVSIGNCVIRKRIQERVIAAKGAITTLIHPNSTISKRCTIATGTVIMPGAVINTEVQIGAGVIVNTSSSIDHDSKIGDYCHIAVGVHVCGTVTIGGDNWIGAGAIINNNLTICNSCVIGAGAVVVKNIEEAGTYIGIPARRKVL